MVVMQNIKKAKVTESVSLPLIKSSCKHDFFVCFTGYYPSVSVGNIYCDVDCVFFLNHDAVLYKKRLIKYKLKPL